MRSDEGSLVWWFGHVERMEKDRIAKRIYRSVGRPWKRWNGTTKECLKKRSLDISQAKGMVQDRSEWQGFVKGNAWGVAQGMNPRP